MRETPLPVQRIEQLAKALKQDPQLVARLRRDLELLLRNTSYGVWFDTQRLLKEPYKLPDELAELMGEFGLSKAAYLQCQVHRVFDEIFITDLPSLDRRVAAYPFTSESEDIHEFIADNALYGWPDSVYDLFCGCGHHLIARSSKFWEKRTKRIGFDINERALSYARVNALINETDVKVFRHDVRDALPLDSMDLCGDKMLFLANAPFLPAPMANVLPPTMDGGVTGADLTVRAMIATKDFWLTTALHVKGIFLAATVGNGPAGDWEVVLTAEEIFGKANVEFKLLTDKKIIKVGGVSSVQVPASIDEITRKADCNLDVTDEDREEVRKGYTNLVETLRLRGWSHFGYVVVSVDLPAKVGS